MKNKKKGKKANNPYFFLGILFVLATLLYANTLGHDYAWDDFIVILNNQYTQEGLNGLADIWTKPVYIMERSVYRPVTQTFFAFEETLFPEGNPSFCHGVNIMLYAICCVLVFVFLKGLFSKYHVLFPFFASLLFAVHPVHTEAVANIKSRDEVLALVFSLLALINFKKFIQTKQAKHLVLPGLFFLAAVLSKENAITLLAIFPLVYFFQKKEAAGKGKKKADGKIGRYVFNLGKGGFSRLESWENPWIFGSALGGYIVLTALFAHPLMAFFGVLLTGGYLLWKGGGAEWPHFIIGGLGLLILSVFFRLEYTFYAITTLCVLYPAIAKKWDWKYLIPPTLALLLFMWYVGKFQFSLVYASVVLFSYLQSKQNKKINLSYVLPLGLGLVSAVAGAYDMMVLFFVALAAAYLKWVTLAKYTLIGFVTLISVLAALELFIAPPKQSAAMDTHSYWIQEKIDPSQEGLPPFAKSETLGLTPINNSIVQTNGNNEKYATIAYVNLLYFAKLWYPHPLVHNYGVGMIPEQSFNKILPWVSVLLYSLLFLYLLVGIPKKDPMAFGIGWYLVTLSVYSHLFILAPDTFAERFLFSPSLGFCVMFVFGLNAILKNDLNRGIGNTPRNILFSAIIIVLSCLAAWRTFDRNQAWEDNLTLATETLPHASNSAFINIHYSSELYRRYVDSSTKNPEDLRKVIQTAERAIEIYPGYFKAMLHLGELYMITKETGKAEQVYTQALGLNPKHIIASLRLGLVYYSSQRYREAADLVQSSMDFYGDGLSASLSKEDFERAHDFLSRCYFNLGEIGKMEATLLKAISADPNNLKYYELLVDFLVQAGQRERAVAYLEQAIAAQPGNGWFQTKLNGLR